MQSQRTDESALSCSEPHASKPPAVSDATTSPFRMNVYVSGLLMLAMALVFSAVHRNFGQHLRPAARQSRALQTLEWWEFERRRPHVPTLIRHSPMQSWHARNRDTWTPSALGRLANDTEAGGYRVRLNSYSSPNFTHHKDGVGVTTPLHTTTITSLRDALPRLWPADSGDGGESGDGGQSGSVGESDGGGVSNGGSDDSGNEPEQTEDRSGARGPSPVATGRWPQQRRKGRGQVTRIRESRIRGPCFCKERGFARHLGC